jgi:hypothetical protein
VLNSVLTALQEAPFAVAIAEGASLFPWIESIHVLALVIVVGTISVVDLRLLGVSSHRKSIKGLTQEILPLTWLAFCVALVSGFLMFASNALTYAANTPFRIKLVLLLLAGANMIFFHIVTHRGIDGWDEAARTPNAARLAGAASLALWIAVVFAGRWIGFTL